MRVRGTPAACCTLPCTLKVTLVYAHVCRYPSAPSWNAKRDKKIWIIQCSQLGRKGYHAEMHIGRAYSLKLKGGQMQQDIVHR